MKAEDTKPGLPVEVYVEGVIAQRADKWVKVVVKGEDRFIHQIWFNAEDVEPINRPTAPTFTWRDYVADAIREGRDAEAVHLIGQKSKGVLPYIQALQELYLAVSKRQMHGVNAMTQREKDLVVEISRLSNVPPPAICAIPGCGEKGKSRPWDRDTRVLCDDHSAQMNMGRE